MRSVEPWTQTADGHPKRWVILGVLLVGLFITVLDNSVLNIALPTIQRDLGASQSQLLWAIDAYVLVFAALLFTWGALGDRWGRKRILIIGLLIFGAASLVGAFSPTADFLIASRAVMGAGGAAVLPTTLAIITVVFPPHERGKAIGVWAGSVGAAVALGPVLGGLLLENPQWASWLIGNDWGSVFLINIPVVVAGVVGVLIVVPETRNPNPRALDLPGLLLSMAGLVLLVYGIIHASETRDWFAPSVVIPGTIGLLVITIFLFLESRSSHPSFDVSLFRNRGYTAALMTISLAFFALSGIIFTFPFYLQTVRGLSTLEAGLVFVPFAVGQLMAAPRSGAMADRFGYRRVMGTGLALLVVSVLGFSQLSIDTPIWLFLLWEFLFGLGMGNVIAPGSTILQNVLPIARVGAGSAVQNTVRQVFGALGVAVVGTVLATRYSSELESAIDAVSIPIPPQARAAALDSVAAADAMLTQAAASGAPASVVDELRRQAFDAFMQAANSALLVSLGAVAAALLVVLVVLPVIEPPQRKTQAPGPQTSGG